jgi:hypothetical protein
VTAPTERVVGGVSGGQPAGGVRHAAQLLAAMRERGVDAILDDSGAFRLTGPAWLIDVLEPRVLQVGRSSIAIELRVEMEDAHARLVARGIRPAARRVA